MIGSYAQLHQMLCTPVLVNFPESCVCVVLYLKCLLFCYHCFSHDYDVFCVCHFFYELVQFIPVELPYYHDHV